MIVFDRMFRLEYQISERCKRYDPEVIEYGELFGEFGEFQMYVNDKVYMEYYPGDPDRWEEPIYHRFYYLLDAIILLETSNYVLISDVETINLWVEIKRNGDNLYISIAKIEKESGGPFITTTSKQNTIYDYFKDEQILYSEFCSEVVSKAERYFLELKELNKHKSDMMPYFEDKLLETKKIVDAKINSI